VVTLFFTPFFNFLKKYNKKWMETKIKKVEKYIIFDIISYRLF
jgi:hypothetical protein